MAEQTPIRHKIPVSVLVVVHTPALDVLLLERSDWPGCLTCDLPPSWDQPVSTEGTTIDRLGGWPVDRAESPAGLPHGPTGPTTTGISNPVPYVAKLWSLFGGK